MPNSPRPALVGLQDLVEQLRKLLLVGGGGRLPYPAIHEIQADALDLAAAVDVR